jgi:DNA-directed RNA polymerase subunit omega
MPGRGLVYPPIDDLLAKVDSRYTLVIASAKRARQINNFRQGTHGEELMNKVPPPRTLEVTKKPLSVSLEEMANGDVAYERDEKTAEKIK